MRILCFKLIFLLVLFFSCVGIKAQSPVIDSIKAAVKIAKEDTNKVRSMNYLSWLLKNNGDLDTAFEYAQQAGMLSEKLSYTRGSVDAFCNQGLLSMYKGNYPKALEYQFQSLRLSEKTNYGKGTSNALSNIGNLYWTQKIYDKALDYQLKALKMREALLPNGKSAGSELELANSLGNIGIIYNDQGIFDKALGYYHRSLIKMEKAGSILGTANTVNNIGNVFYDQGVIDSALFYYRKSLPLYEKAGNKSGTAAALINIAGAHVLLEKYDEAEKYANQSLEICKEIGELEGIKDANRTLYEINERRRHYEKALGYYKNFIQAQDSLVNDENTKKNIRLEMNYEFDKKEAATRLEQEKKEAISEAESRKQRIIILSICGILLLVAGFAVFAYRSYLQKQKANVEITKQKEIIEEKQKEILDSIHYAKRIQKALITSETYVEKHLGRHRKSA